jgi:uncharacterized protein (TIGR02145 family)
MKQKMIFLALTLFVLSAASANAQVTIGSTNNPHPGVVLDLQSTTQGLKLPVVSLNDISVFQLDGDSTQAVGIVVYNNNFNVKNGNGVGLYNWSGYRWNTLKQEEPCPSSVVDIDGNTYAAKQFGSQCWMTQDLRVTRTPAGVALDSVKLNGGFFNTANAAVTVEWDGSQVVYIPDVNSGIGANYSENGIAYSDVEWSEFAAKFGFSYSYTNAMKACPTGWHLPTDSEFRALGFWSRDIFRPSFNDGVSGKLRANNYVYIARDDNTERKWGGIAPNHYANAGVNLYPTGIVRLNNTAARFGDGWFAWTSSWKGDYPVLDVVFAVYNGIYSYANAFDYVYASVRCLKTY